MRGNALRQPNAQESVASARARLSMLLLNARSLDGFTAEGLAATHRVRVGEAAEMLERERGRRGV